MTPGYIDAESAFAETATTFTLSQVPESAQETARLVVLDTIGISIYGSTGEYITDVIAVAEQFGWGTAKDYGATSMATWNRHAPLLAAEANATAASSTEYYEGIQGAGMAGIHIVPAAIAMGEQINADGQSVLEAVILGYEISARVGAVLRPFRGNLHGHGGNHPIGVAAAIGHLLEFDEQTFTEAFRIAANPLVVGHWDAISQGKTIRNYYSGICVTHGIWAALLAKAGIEGMENSIERCLAATVSDSTPTDEDYHQLIADLGDTYALDSNLFKMYPSCRYTHAPLEAIRSLRDEVDITPDQVESVTVYTSEFATHGDIQEPQNSIEAKYSIPYIIAVALTRDRVDVDAFSPEVIGDTELQKLSKRIKTVRDAAYEERASQNNWGAAVEVTLTGGQTVRKDVYDAESGRDVGRPELVEKFDRLLERCDVPVDADKLRTGCLQLEEVKSIRTLLSH